MKTEELKRVLEILIRKEVKRVVAEEVSKAMGKVLVEMVREIKSNNGPTLTESVEEEPLEEVIHTKNPKLNSVLAETARNFKPLPRTADMATGLADLMDGGFEKVGQNENIGLLKEAPNKLDFLKQMVGPSGGQAVMNAPSALDGGTEVPDALKKVFKKDFRSIMKKIYEQKKNGGGGYIDPTKVLAG